MSKYEFSDGAFTVDDVTMQFFKLPRAEIVNKVLETFRKDRNYNYPKNQVAIYDKSATLRTQCRCNFYRLKCNADQINCESKTIEVSVSKQLNSVCSCEVRVAQLRGEKRNEVKNQLRMQEVFELGNQNDSEVIEKVRAPQVTQYNLFYLYSLLINVIFFRKRRTTQAKEFFKLGKRRCEQKEICTKTL